MDYIRQTPDTATHVTKNDNDDHDISQVRRDAAALQSRFKKTTKLIEQLDELKNQLANELAGLLHASPSAEQDNDTTEDSETDAEDQVGPIVESTLGPTKPEIGYVDWNVLMTNTSAAKIDAFEVRCAVEIPTNEPLGLFDPGTPWTTVTGVISNPNSQGLPERIRINSPRLINLLKYHLNDEELPEAHLVQPLCILRPFKILLWHEARIRACLASVRSALSKLLSKETNGLFDVSKLSPPSEDSWQPQRLDFSAMSEAELTEYEKEIKCLVGFVDDKVLPAKKKLENDADIVSYSELWYLFPHGSYIYVHNSDPTTAQRIWRVYHRFGGRRHMERPEEIQPGAFRHQPSLFKMDCYCLDYNGTQYVPVYRWFTEAAFEGTKPVTALSVWPLRVAVKEGLVSRQALTDQGKAFMEYTQVSHQYYSGWSHGRDPSGVALPQDSSEKFDSEVIVDYKRGVENNPSWAPDDDPLQISETFMTEFGGREMDVDKDWIWDKRFSDSILDDVGKAETPRGDDLLVLPDRVFAFVLRHRKWAPIRVGLTASGDRPLQPMTYQSDVWEGLVLEEDRKKLVQALVKTHFEKGTGDSGQDLIRGKGQGLIVLL